MATASVTLLPLRHFTYIQHCTNNVALMKHSITYRLEWSYSTQ